METQPTLRVWGCLKDGSREPPIYGHAGQDPGDGFGIPKPRRGQACHMVQGPEVPTMQEEGPAAMVGPGPQGKWQAGTTGGLVHIADCAPAEGLRDPAQGC
ncbi:hypothetical protein HPB47_000653 [Ixodes persulcatus]|uniref:Uncharacterized protein n=1 Tax=Ixodes persulcatus TaxID=34615 RepID=A0AC60PSP1_IXOPE|nr:hypothetical protein HPB47_000653 [Ixodes persulcatus]